jgi:hypothetical protein
MSTYRAVNWFEEGLNTFYGDNNNGFIYGVYYYEDVEDFPQEVQWYATEQERDSVMEAV